jgi:hypothetical protein
MCSTTVFFSFANGVFARSNSSPWPRGTSFRSQFEPFHLHKILAVDPPATCSMRAHTILLVLASISALVVDFLIADVGDDCQVGNGLLITSCVVCIMLTVPIALVTSTNQFTCDCYQPYWCWICYELVMNMITISMYSQSNCTFMILYEV